MGTRPDIVVVGAGLIGLCTAHYLVEAGFSVTVIEKGASVAEGASRQNGGLLTPSMSDPWNAPGIQWQLIKYLGRSDAPMLLRPGAIHHYLGWGIKFLRNSTAKRYAEASIANLELSNLASRRLGELRSNFGIDYTWAQTGALNVFRDDAALDGAKVRAERISAGYPGIEILDAAGVVEKEPVLEDVAADLVGGIYFPHDETGDAFQFCVGLAASLAKRGVRFEFDTEAGRMLTRGGRLIGVRTNRGEMDAGAVVIAAASAAPGLALGPRLRIKPVKGYSISIPVKSLDPLPRMPVIDDGLHAAVTPLGQSLRVAGTAEFCGWNDTLDLLRVKNLWDLLTAVSPTLAANADRENSKPWCGFRPMSADGVPFIGETRTKGLYINAGHGHLGWTQATGSGALVAELMAEAATSIDAGPYSPLR